MKKTKQSGFAHIMIIVVILSVALIGTLGFVFWQNFMQPKTVAAHSTSNSNSSITTDPVVKTPTEDENTLKISDWAIKGVYSGSHSVTFVINTTSTGGGATLDFKSSEFTCGNSTVASIERSTGDAFYAGVGTDGTKTVAQVFANDSFTEWGGNKHIGDYFYIYHGPQQACDPAVVPIERDVHTFFGTLKAI